MGKLSLGQSFRISPETMQCGSKLGTQTNFGSMLNSTTLGYVALSRSFNLAKPQLTACFKLVCLWTLRVLHCLGYCT